MVKVCIISPSLYAFDVTHHPAFEDRNIGRNPYGISDKERQEKGYCEGDIRCRQTHIFMDETEEGLR